MIFREAILVNLATSLQFLLGEEVAFYLQMLIKCSVAGVGVADDGCGSKGFQVTVVHMTNIPRLWQE